MLRHAQTSSHQERSSFRWVIWLVAVMAMLVLSACTQLTQDSDASLAASQPAYLLTIENPSGVSASELEALYGGTVQVMGADYAVLGFDTDPQAAAQGFSLLNAGQFQVESNDRMFAVNDRSLIWSGGRSLIWSGGRSLIWSGGRSLIWSGGRSLIWSGGRSLIWSGGSNPTYEWLPENTPTWAHIDLDRAHEVAGNLGYGVIVAIIDTGMDMTHPLLVPALDSELEARDFVDGDTYPHEDGTYDDYGFGHGTMVAGIVRQIAPAATILPIRVLDREGKGFSANLAAAIAHAVSEGAHVLNLSLGSDRMSPSVERAIQSAVSRGVYVIASSGNTGDSHVTYPASRAFLSDLRVSVGSATLQDKVSDFSTRHPLFVEISAPGEEIWGPLPTTEYGDMGYASGTSMAAPVVTGAVALALGENLRVSSSGLERYLDATAANLGDGWLSFLLGGGRIDVGSFIERVVMPGWR